MVLMVNIKTTIVKTVDIFSNCMMIVAFSFSSHSSQFLREIREENEFGTSKSGMRQ